MLSIITAYDQNKAIGYKGTIPWHIGEDLKHFKKMTIGCPIILGRKTWESLDRILPNRDHFVLSRNLQTPVHKLAHRVYQVRSLELAAELARHTAPDKEGWIIGGGEIYRLAINEGWVDKIVASEIKGAYHGDTFFPDLGEGWEKVPVTTHDLFDVVWYVKSKTEFACL
jgi:dihydrofolate reductase